MVVLDKQDYINQSTGLPGSNAYLLMVDSTNKHKSKLTNLLRTIKAQGGLGDSTYKNPLLNRHSPPPQNSMGYPNYIKKDMRPIFSRRVMTTYGLAKVLANILSPLVAHSLITSGTLNILWTRSN